jgi:hypothetical protein
MVKTRKQLCTLGVIGASHNRALANLDRSFPSNNQMTTVYQI